VRLPPIPIDGESTRRLLATGSWEPSSLVHLAAMAIAGELPLMAKFEFIGAQVAEGRMSPLPIPNGCDRILDFAH
jgi:hypothetical protein